MYIIMLFYTQMLTIQMYQNVIRKRKVSIYQLSKLVLELIYIIFYQVIELHDVQDGSRQGSPSPSALGRKNSNRSNRFEFDGESMQDMDYREYGEEDEAMLGRGR